MILLLVLSVRCFIVFSSSSASIEDSTSTKWQCPRFCECSTLDNSRPSGALEVKCRGEPYEKLDISVFATWPKERVEILDLSGNRIRTISVGVFDGFVRLKKLVLSDNELDTIRSSWFQDLRMLEELSLAGNPISTVPEKSLEPLTNLRYIDLATPYLTCDCNMKWFRRWIGKSNVKKTRPSSKRSRITLSTDTLCQFPARLRGKPFMEMTRKGLVCSGILEPASFSLEPAAPRVLPEGATARLKCNVSTMKDKEILEWLHDGKPVEKSETYGLATHFDDGGLFHISELRIRDFQVENEGTWSCRLETPKGSVQKAVGLWMMRISNASVCPAERTVDRKGTFNWPATFVMSRAELPCPSSVQEDSTTNASRFCGEDARWSEPVTEQCDYESPFFRRLTEIKEGQVDAVLEALRNVTMEMKDGEGSPTAEDVNLALHLVEKMALTASDVEERMMLDIVNDLLKVKTSILSASDQAYRTARRFLNILRSSATSASQTEFAIEDCSISINDEAGIAIVYADMGGLECSSREAQSNGRRVQEAAISIEIDLSFTSELQTPNLVIPLRFLWYRQGAALSRMVHINGTEEDNWTPTQSVIGVISNRFADVSGFVKNNNSGQMILRWRRPKRSGDVVEAKVASLVTDYKTGPVHWAFMDDCTPLTSSTRMIAFSCPLTLGLFTLVRRQDLQRRRVGDGRPITLAPWMLASSGFAATCLVGAVLIYCCCHRAVKFSVKLCHALVNSWLALAMLILTFALGIDRLAEETLCMVVAILLHYTTLAVTLWFFLVARTLQRKLRKLVHPKKADLSDGELSAYNDGRPKPRHGPLVGMYFLAWGLPAMPCAFTLPLRMDSYTANEEFCFMEPNFIALVAFAVPAIVLALTISILLIKVFRLQRALEKRRDRSQAAPTDVTLVPDESNVNATSNAPVDNADAFSTVSTEIGDDDGGPRKHLATMAAVFVLTILTYGFGATVMTRPWRLLEMDEMEKYLVWTTTGLYALAVTMLGLVIFWTYILGRRHMVVGCRKRKTAPKEPNSVAVVVKKPAATNEQQRATRQHRSRPPTTSVGPAEERLPYRQESMVGSVYDQSMDASGLARRTANAGTTVTRPPSELSGTIAPSGTNVSTSRSYRMQQAVARKYYEKQRALKMSASTAGPEEDGAAPEDQGEPEKVEEPKKEVDLESPVEVEEAQPEKRKPSVELYRKPSRNGPVAQRHQSGSDEDSTPEALRHSEQNGGYEKNGLDRKLLRVHSSNETSV